MHLKRWITVIVALPFLISLICWGGLFLFTAFICVVCLVSLWEYFSIVLNATDTSIYGLIPLLTFITGPLMIWACIWKTFNGIVCLLALHLLLSGLIALVQYKSDPNVLDTLAKQIQGLLYIPLLLSFIVMLRDGTNGVAWIFFLLFLVFSGDTGAFYVGSYFGRHKLIPAVSPGKTVEGAIGGLSATMALGSLFKWFFLPHLPWGGCIVLFICVGFTAPLGDLFESLLKRVGKVKDSGKILPGHGGLLDRIDALLFAAPIAYLFREYIL